MATAIHRIAINAGGGNVSGLNAVLAGAVLSATRLGWEIVGIRDGYDGLMIPERYPDGGLVKLSPLVTENLNGMDGSILGTTARTDPFRVRAINEDDYVEEADRSDELLARIRAEGIDAVISIVGGSALTGAHALGVAFKLNRKGLRTICVPKSVENDCIATALSLGFDSALNYTTDTLARIRVAARDVGRIAVVEVLGDQAGWLALQSGMAVCADAVLIPEIPYDLRKLAAGLRDNGKAGRSPSLVVVAEGATPKNGDARPHDPGSLQRHGLRKSLSPLSDPRFGEGARVIERSGLAAETVALKLQQLTDIETFPVVLGQMVRAGGPTAIDRQLGLGYGAGAVHALDSGHDGVMVAYQPPDLKFVPLVEAINKVRTVPESSKFVQIVRSLGIFLGD